MYIDIAPYIHTHTHIQGLLGMFLGWSLMYTIGVALYGYSQWSLYRAQVRCIYVCVYTSTGMHTYMHVLALRGYSQWSLYRAQVRCIYVCVYTCTGTYTCMCALCMGTHSGACIDRRCDEYMYVHTHVRAHIHT